MPEMLQRNRSLQLLWLVDPCAAAVRKWAATSATDAMPQYHRLYHYTASASYHAVTGEPDGVIERMVRWVRGSPDPDPLKPSMGEGGKDAFHGPGWYMTDIAPGSFSRRGIATRLWDGGGFGMAHRTEYWLAYDVHHRAVVPCRKHVFLIRASSKAQLRLVNSGRTPDVDD